MEFEEAGAPPPAEVPPEEAIPVTPVEVVEEAPPEEAVSLRDDLGRGQ